MEKTGKFYNQGFGWICINCEQKFDLSESSDVNKKSRLMSEGEAESKNPRFSNKALAKWTDEAKNQLICPHCGITEKFE